MSEPKHKPHEKELTLEEVLKILAEIIAAQLAHRLRNKQK